MTRELRFPLTGASFGHLINLIENFIQSSGIPLQSDRRMGERAYILDLTRPGEVTPAITFEVMTLLESRLAVIARLSDPSAGEWFDDILGEVANYWPEMADVLREDGRAGRGMNVGTAEKVARARFMIEQEGVQQSMACNRAGVAPKTYRRWHDAPEVEEALQELLEEA